MIAEAVAGNHSIVNYDIFIAIFAFLSLIYLILATVKESFYHPLVVLILDAVNTLFFLCGAIATAAYLGVHSCSNRVRDKSGRCAYAPLLITLGGF
jgi:hypothetical protein